MASVKAGSVAAFGVLYDRYCNRAYRIARAVCGDDGCAQEAVQETFMSVWNSRATYVSRGAPAAWVLTLARHRAIDVARRNHSHVANRASDTMLDVAPARGDLADDVVAAVTGDVVRALLRGLPDNQREAVTLAFYGQLSHTEIAVHLGVPVGTVKGRVRLGLEKLRYDLATEQR